MNQTLPRLTSIFTVILTFCFSFWGRRPMAPYWGFAPGLHWETSVPRLPDSAPYEKSCIRPCAQWDTAQTFAARPWRSPRFSRLYRTATGSCKVQLLCFHCLSVQEYVNNCSNIVWINIHIFINESIYNRPYTHYYNEAPAIISLQNA